MQTRTICMVSAAMAALMLTSCVDATDEEAPIDDEIDEEVGAASGGRPPVFGAFERAKVWTKDTLTVCWHPSAGATQHGSIRTLVRNMVIREWGSLGRIRFDWTLVPCTASSTMDIRIGHDPAAFGWSQIGTMAQTVPAGEPTMVVNLNGPPPGGCVQLPGGGGGMGTPPLPPPIVRCDGVLAGGATPPSVDVWVVATALHEFGHALGLRHEHARDDATCINPEVLDGSGYDGEAVWAYDDYSIMGYCWLGVASSSTLMPELGAGDIRALHTLYPGVAAIFPHANFDGVPVWLGPGYYTRTTTPALAGASSLVVPPGFTAWACTTSSCASYTQSVSAVPLSFNDAIQNLTLSASVSVYDDPGYRGLSQALTTGSHRASLGQLNTIGDNHVSSMWVPPTRDATLCSGDNHSGVCSYFSGGGLSPTTYALAPGLDDQTSSVQISSRAVTYSDAAFRGTTTHLAVGTYKVSTGSTFLLDVRAIAVAGLKFKACTGEGGFPLPGNPGGSGTCRTSESSAELSSVGQIRFLDISVPLVVGP